MLMLGLSPLARWIGPLVALVLVGASACNDSKVNQAAKERIFSPEEPALDVRKAAETIDLDSAVSDGAVWARLWTMERMEVTRRIGAHRATSKVNFKWTREGKTVELNEEAVFETDADGQFHATLTNDQDAGLEFIWVNGKAFAKGRYGEYRARRTDRAKQDSLRNQATSALRTIYELIDRKLHGAAAGTVQVSSRPARRFSLSLGDAWGPVDPKSKLPPPTFGKVRASGKEADDETPDAGTRDTKFVPGPDEQTARRLEFSERKTAESISGDVVVDEKSAVILKGTVKAKFRVPEADPQSGAVLLMTVSYVLEPMPALKIEAPKNVTAPRLPHAVNNPLWFLDGGSAAAPAGGAEDEPSGTGEDDEAR